MTIDEIIDVIFVDREYNSVIAQELYIEENISGVELSKAKWIGFKKYNILHGRYSPCGLCFEYEECEGCPFKKKFFDGCVNLPLDRPDEILKALDEIKEK